MAANDHQDVNKKGDALSNHEEVEKSVYETVSLLQCGLCYD